MSLAGAVGSAPRRHIAGRYWHQGPTRHPLTACTDPARGTGRYHRTGESGVWYGSSQEQGAWAELFRHFLGDGIDPFEVRRRVGRVHVALDVLDLTDSKVRAHLGIAEADLIGDDYDLTQSIASAALEAGFDGVLAPGAALPAGTHWRSSLTPYLSSRPNIPMSANPHRDWRTWYRSSAPTKASHLPSDGLSRHSHDPVQKRSVANERATDDWGHVDSLPWTSPTRLDHADKEP